MMKKLTLFLAVLFCAAAIAQDPPATAPTAAPAPVTAPESAPTAVPTPEPVPAVPAAEPVAAPESAPPAVSAPEPAAVAPTAVPAAEPEPVPVAPAAAPMPTPATAAAQPPAPDAAAVQGKQTVAVYMAGKEPRGAKGVHSILGGELARTISASQKYIAVDRTEAIQQQLASEHAFQRSGAVDDDQIKNLGRQLGVQFLCISDINPVGSGSYYLDVRLVDVVTAEIIRTATANSNMRNAEEMKRVARSIAYELIETEKAKQQQKRRKKLLLSTAISLDVIGLGLIAYGFIENENMNNHSDTKTFSEAENAKTRRDAAYVIGAALLASGITIHILF